MSQSGPQALVSACYHYIMDMLFASKAIVEEPQKLVCAAGDIFCETTDGKWGLPSKLSALINTVEEKTGINRYYSGPATLLVVGAIAGNHIYRKYGIKPILDEIRKLIEIEFGKSAIAREIFEAIKKAIEEEIDRRIEDFIGKFQHTNATLSANERADQRKQFIKQLYDEMMPQLAQNLKENKTQIESQAQIAAFPIADIIAQQVIPGAQNDANRDNQEQRARKSLKDLLAKNVVAKSRQVSFKKIQNK
ncbi:MAG: hypothetical protein AB7V32_00645 [Candidatus Berkiella sp.]